jgi:hypothetical protein
MNATIQNIDFWQGASHKVRFEYHHDWESADGSALLKEIGMVVWTSIDLLDANIYGRLVGREFQDSWNTRRTAGNAIVKGVDVLESMIRDELGVTSSTDINESAFDTAATARTWEAIGQVTEVEFSLDVFKGLCENFGLVYFVDIDGKETVRVLKHNATPDLTLTLMDFADNSLEITYTQRNAIVSDYVVHYGWNPTSETFAFSEYCNRNDSSLTTDAAAYETKCSNAYASLGNEENRREWDARWMYTESDAELFLKFLIDWNHQRRLRIKGEVFLDYLGLEIGDLVAFYNLYDYLPNHLLEDTIFVVDGVQLNKDRGTMKISFLQVLEP